MQVIILKTGELRKVADGYARNYLFPNKLAVAATAAAQKEAEAIRSKVEAEHSAQLAAQTALAEQLKGQSITLTAKANETGKLFAAIHAGDIVVALAKVGFVVTAEQLNFAPIKQTGTHTVNVELPKQSPVTLTLNVTAQ